MNKVLVTAPGELTFVEQPDPPLGPNDVRIAVRLSGLSSRSEIERYLRVFGAEDRVEQLVKV